MLINWMEFAEQISQTDVKEEKLWAFMASRQSKVVQKKVKKFQRTKKAGAGRELIYQKEEINMQKKLDETRTKEWQNWLNRSTLMEYGSQRLSLRR